MIVYLITNKINHKKYIGKTILPLTRRFQNHINKSTKGSLTYFHRAIRKYGKEHFTCEILDRATSLEELNQKEMIWIKTIAPEYNMTVGGDGGDTSKSPNYIEGMKHRDLSGSKNGMWGTKRHIPEEQLNKAHARAWEANKCPVICEGVTYASVGEAQKQYPGIKIRNRLDNPKWPQFFRLRPKTKRK